jgi:hypothetical protein
MRLSGFIGGKLGAKSLFENSKKPSKSAYFAVLF